MLHVYAAFIYFGQLEKRNKSLRQLYSFENWRKSLFLRPYHIVLSFKLLLRSLSFLLVSAFVWSQVGPVAVLYSRVMHYREIHRSPEAGRNTDTIFISEEDLPDVVWVKKNEIRYHGRMFDIARRMRSNGRVMFTGHYDKKDDNLFAALSSFVGKGGAEHNKDEFHLMLLEFDAVLTDAMIVRSLLIHPSEGETSLFPHSNYISSDKDPLLQPPRHSS
jgi:hypothetical protein